MIIVNGKKICRKNDNFLCHFPTYFFAKILQKILTFTIMALARFFWGRLEHFIQLMVLIYVNFIDIITKENELKNSETLEEVLKREGLTIDDLL